MFIEKKLKAVPPRLLTANGAPTGLVTVADTRGFFVKQKISLSSNTQAPLQLEIKRFVSINSFFVGPPGGIGQRQNVSMYLVADGATIEASEQDRPGVPDADRDRATYVEEPIVARRVIAVDEYGRYYNNENPLPTTATLNVDELNVDIDFDPNNPDDATSSNTGAYLRAPNGDLITVTANGPKRSLDVNDSATQAELQSILTQLAGTLDVNDAGSQALLTAIENLLTSIEAGTPDSLGQNTMANSQPVTIASDQTPIPISGNITATLGDEPIKISGTENGQPNGPEFPFVNNVLQQILKAKDRSGTIQYADFGTKNQRITQITYTAPSIGAGAGFTAVKTFNYTLVGTKYRRDTPGDWSIV
jgi:hypothetical protein